MQITRRPTIVRLLAAGLLVTALIALLLASTSSMSPAVAQTPVANTGYNANSPHWSHINILDFGTNLMVMPDNASRRAGYEWYARHVDSMHIPMDIFGYSYDANIKASAIKALNPTFKAMGYDIDLYMCQNMTCYEGNPANTAVQNLPEEYYLHFANDTHIDFFEDDGKSPHGDIDITGCPESGPVTPACRVQIYMFSQDKLWVSNVKSTAWRTWRADRLLEETTTNNGVPNPIDVLFFDGHGGPGLSGVLSFGRGMRNVIQAGGAIREYGRKVPRDYSVGTYDDLDQEYSADVASWLTYLRSRLEASGKSLRINTGTEIYNPIVFQQVLAAKGALPEYFHSAMGFVNGTNQYPPFLTAVRQVTAAGGTVDLYYRPCSDNQPGMTPGNFDTAVNRFRMWNLASYYMAKESPNETGTVYFDPGFCIDPASTTTAHDLDAQWLPAYEKDVGLPTGEPVVVKSSQDDCLYNDGYIIYSRQYSKARMLVRPKGGYWCQDYGDSTIVNVPLESPMSILQSDGTLSEPMRTVPIRNAEAVILMTPPDTAPPARVNDLRAE